MCDRSLLPGSAHHDTNMLPFTTLPRGEVRSPSKPLPLKKRSLLLGFSLALASGLALAAPLQLREALQRAVNEHPSIAASRSQRQAALMQLDGAERQRYPGLVAQSGRDATGQRITTLRLQQALWTGGRITGEIDAANATIRQSDAALVQSEQDIMLRVVAAFTELGRVLARQTAARDNLQEHERLASMIERRVASQVSPSSDSIQANARLSQARAELQQLDAQAFKARAALAQTTGETVTDIALPKAKPAAMRGLDDILAAAVVFAPSIRKLTGELEVANANIAVRRSAAYPQVTLRLDRSYGGLAAGSQVYVSLDYQTGAGFAVQASVREAEAKKDAILSQIEAARRETIDSVSGDWADFNALNAQLGNLQAQVASTTAVFDSFVRQYAVGRKGWNDVLNAQREVAQARYQLADTESGALRAALRLDLLTGRITSETLDEIPSPPAAPLSAEPPAPSAPAALSQPLPGPTLARFPS
jgi:adhesin transport system outer membrane protein